MTADQGKPPVMNPYFIRKLLQILTDRPIHHNRTADTFIFHEKITVFKVAGILLVMAGIFILNSEEGKES